MKRADAETIKRVRAFTLRRGMRSQDGAGTVTAYVNHGRWVADCPCGGAELIVENEPMLCGSCAHSRMVVWPADVEAIESMLEVRDDRNQNWQPGQTVEVLEAENLARGI